MLIQILREINVKPLMAFHAAALLVCAFLAGCTGEVELELTIAADGKAVLVSRTGMPRAEAEALANAATGAGMRERMIQWDEGSAPVDKPQTQPAAPKGPISPADIEAAVRKMQDVSNPLAAGAVGVARRIEKVEVGEKFVVIHSRVTFDNLEALVRHGPSAMQLTGGLLRLEATEDGKIRLTMKMPDRGQVDEEVGPMRSMLKASPVKASIKVTLPGEIRASDLGPFEGKTTSFQVDTAAKDGIESLLGLLKKKQIVITADAGGLSLKGLPLETPTLEEQMQESGNAEDQMTRDLPIVEAAEGYLADAMMVQSTMVHLYPRAKELLGEVQNMVAGQPDQTEVQAKLSPPRNRFIVGIVGGKVTEAKDNKGRPIKPVGAGISPSGLDWSHEQIDRQFQINLQLPPPDAKAVEELKTELIVVSRGPWKEQNVGALKPAPDKAIDLSSILPGAGAKMVIFRTSTGTGEGEGKMPENMRSGIAQIKFIGPPEIRLLALDIRIAGIEDVNSYNQSDEDITSPENAKDHQRMLTVEYHVFDRSGGGAGGGAGGAGKDKSKAAPTLAVRFPSDLRKERVPVTLKGMDLY